MRTQQEICVCHKPPIHHSDYEISFLGVDKTNGRFAEVTIEKCKHCGTEWINYLVENEAFTRSGRWYRGILENGQGKIKPENVETYLENLDWYIFGGSYFNSTGKTGKGTLVVN